MLTVHCPARDHYVDLSPRSIESIELRAERLVVRWHCWCGHRGVSLTRAARQPVSVSAERRAVA